MEKENLPDFDGKLLVLYVSGAPPSFENGTFLEFASFTAYGGRLFVVGRMPSMRGEWFANIQSGVAWDSVNHYLVFDSVEDYHDRVPQAGRKVKSPLLRIFGR